MSANLHIRKAEDAAGRERFLDLPFRLYRDDPCWVPPLRSAQRKVLAGRTAFFDHAEMALFLAEREGRVVGRIAAIHNKAHTDRYQDGMGFFGFFEVELHSRKGSSADCADWRRLENKGTLSKDEKDSCCSSSPNLRTSAQSADGFFPEDAEAAAGLVKAAEDWLRARGLKAVRGPVNPSMNDSCGTLIEGFDRPPMALMPYNPPAYGPCLESLGLTKCKDLYAYLISREDCCPGTENGDRLVRLAAALKRRRSEVTLRHMEMKNYPQDILRFIHIFEEARHDNWGCVPLTEKEILETASQMKAIVDPQIIILAEVNGQPAGAILAIPNFSPALRAAGGRMFPFGFLRFMRAMKRADEVRIFGVAVLKQYRPLGVTALLFLEEIIRGMARGYRAAEASWVLEDNHLSNSSIQSAVNPVRYKTYRIYEKPIV